MTTFLHVVTLVALCLSVIFSALTVVNLRAAAYYRLLRRLACPGGWPIRDYYIAHPPVSVRIYEALDRGEVRVRRLVHR